MEPMRVLTARFARGRGGRGVETGGKARRSSLFLSSASSAFSSVAGGCVGEWLGAAPEPYLAKKRPAWTAGRIRGAAEEAGHQPISIKAIANELLGE